MNDDQERDLTPEEWGLTEPIYPREIGFKKSGASITKGHELINSGELETVKVGSRTYITARSIANHLNKNRVRVKHDTVAA